MATIKITRYCPDCKRTTKHEARINRAGMATSFKCLARKHAVGSSK